MITIWETKISLRKWLGNLNEKWDSKWASCCMKAVPRQHALGERNTMKNSGLMKTIWLECFKKTSKRNQDQYRELCSGNHNENNDFGFWGNWLSLKAK